MAASCQSKPTDASVAPTAAQTHSYYVPHLAVPLARSRQQLQATHGWRFAAGNNQVVRHAACRARHVHALIKLQCTFHLPCSACPAGAAAAQGTNSKSGRLRALVVACAAPPCTPVGIANESLHYVHANDRAARLCGSCGCRLPHHQTSIHAPHACDGHAFISP